MAQKTIMTVCAHNDDQIIGAGGTIVRHVQQGGKAVTLVMCFGEMSHPHLRREVVVKTRVKESDRAKKIIGDEVFYFGLPEGDIAETAQKRRIKEKLKIMIHKYKPEKIFTHSTDDPHPDHRATLKVLLAAVDEIGYRGEVYTFDVWNPVNIRRRNSPKLVVDITETFHKKLQSFKVHKSQKLTFLFLTWQVWLRAFLAGWNNKCRYAEVFYKLR